MNKTNTTIGYLVKQLDRLLTEGINDIQSEFSLNRTSWQVLHSIHEHTGISKPELTELIKPFADEDELHIILQTFQASQLAEEKDGNVVLTEKGKDLHKACFEKQQVYRQKTIQNITQQEYMQAVAMLQKMISNLEE